ncbi:hypothetical protein IEQ44_13870 [Nocardioides sp. Y6]|uniref:VanZ-like domain-containing protein n=1 Tax=Nocardioides malaquae TaxID=2773426 RepID=A0ABR9RVW6_9ACTN|nr:hypothetical protein [Nocardioides malaquae]MBE7325736.1 hypothetical protein [Nocardioides malaquae]
MSELAVGRYPIPSTLRLANVSAKAGLVLLLVFALLFPDDSNMRDKAAGVRAVVYPLLAFTVPAIWYVHWRERSSFPWLADFLVTITCFTDILGNRLDMYDSIVWFDDWMHFMNTGLLAAAVILLTMHRSVTLGRVVERALAVGATGAIAWEIGEFFAFISGSSERRFAYADTLSDLGLGVLGALVAAVLIHRLWARGRLVAAAPQLDHTVRV